MVEAVRRTREGPLVVEVLRQGVMVDGRRMNLVVSRCEGHYRISAWDLIHGSTYEGFCYEEEVRVLLNENNLWNNEIKPYQYESVARLLVARLRLIFSPEDEDAIRSVDNGGITSVYIAPSRRRGVINASSHFDRSLRDQSSVLTKYRQIKQHRHLSNKCAY